MTTRSESFKTIILKTNSDFIYYSSHYLSWMTSALFKNAYVLVNPISIPDLKIICKDLNCKSSDIEVATIERSIIDTNN